MKKFIFDETMLYRSKKVKCLINLELTTWSQRPTCQHLSLVDDACGLNFTVTS